jgi:hypothetical protein
MLNLFVSNYSCPVLSPLVMGQLTYDNSLQMAFVPANAFSFPDRSLLNFRCQIQVCNKVEGECMGVAPPNCPTMSPNDYSPNSQINANVDPTQVVGTYSNPISNPIGNNYPPPPPLPTGYGGNYLSGNSYPSGGNYGLPFGSNYGSTPPGGRYGQQQGYPPSSFPPPSPLPYSGSGYGNRIPMNVLQSFQRPYPTRSGRRQSPTSNQTLEDGLRSQKAESGAAPNLVVNIFYARQDH